jgi:hypothetical protein
MSDTQNIEETKEAMRSAFLKAAGRISPEAAELPDTRDELMDEKAWLEGMLQAVEAKLDALKD